MSGAYDERLLASAPAATRAEKQEGYNIDLLDNHLGGPSHTPPPVPVLAPNHTKAEAGGYAYPPPARLPWYKTRKWIFILALGAVVVLAAVIGGAVGGTVGHSSKSAPATNGTDTGGGGAAGPVVSEAPGGPAAAASTDASQAATTTGGESPASAASAAAAAGSP